MPDIKTIRRVGAWRHTHNGKLPGGDLIALYREHHLEPDVYLFYERDADLPSWSMRTDTGAIERLNRENGQGHGLIVEDAGNRSG